MFPLLFKSYVYLNITIIIFVSGYLVFSKRMNPKIFQKISKKYFKTPKIIKTIYYFYIKHYISDMKNEYSSDDLKKLEDKIDRLQNPLINLKTL